MTELFGPELFTAKAAAIFVQIIFIDLVLAGDNAIIVGMVASRVPQHLRKKVILFGIGAAVIMRIGFSLIAIQLLSITGLKFFGGLLLLWVCWRLWVELRADNAQHNEAAEASASDASDQNQLATLWPAVIQIVIADLSTSIDNVLAIEGISRELTILLIFGLALSVAFMIFAATMIAKLLQRYPWIAYVGLALIFYVGIVMTREGGLELLPLIKG